jgi:hypothetical protein
MRWMLDKWERGADRQMAPPRSGVWLPLKKEAELSVGNRAMGWCDPMGAHPILSQ